MEWIDFCLSVVDAVSDVILFVQTTWAKKKSSQQGSIQRNYKKLNKKISHYQTALS